jgi:UDP-3-O-[3-hydroxymyristoyl] glucosamine N-acyltransferase
VRVHELAKLLEANWEGDGEREVFRFASLEEAGPSDVAFATGGKALAMAAASRAGCLLVPKTYQNESRQTLIRVADPRASAARAISALHPASRFAAGIHPSAVIDPGASIGEGVSIGPNACVGRASIGEGTRIGPGSVIGDNVRIGDQCVVHANVTVYHDVSIGDRCVLHAGAVIGADGFGFVFAQGNYEKFPQIGRVELENGVEIGACTCIDRAALGVTSIGEGTKLDNMVHVGHNCRIGKHVVVAAQTGFSGGVVVEDYAVIGGQVGVGDKARIESGAVIGSGAGILTSKIVRAGEPVWGTPARPLRQHLKQLAALARLPEVIAGQKPRK